VYRPAMKIRLKGGRLLSRRVDCVPGDPSPPVTRDAHEAKFRDYVSVAAMSLALKNIAAAIVLIDDLENVTDVAEIMRPLTPELAT
jgi:hypothetical protein